MPQSDLEEVRGIGPVTARRLFEAGIRSVEQLASETAETLADITGMSLTRTTAILKSAKTIFESAEPASVPEKEGEPPEALTKTEQSSKNKNKNKKKKKSGQKKNRKSKENKKSTKKGKKKSGKKKDKKKKKKKNK